MLMTCLEWLCKQASGVHGKDELNRVLTKAKALLELDSILIDGLWQLAQRHLDSTNSTFGSISTEIGQYRGRYATFAGLGVIADGQNLLLVTEDEQVIFITQSHMHFEDDWEMGTKLVLENVPILGYVESPWLDSAGLEFLSRNTKCAA